MPRPFWPCGTARHGQNGRGTPFFRIRSHSAFTLIELLVVISIIALLIGILLPALGKAREQGQSIRCLTNLRSLGTSMAMYFNDSNGTLPWIDPADGVDMGNKNLDLFEVLEPYIDVPLPKQEDPHDNNSPWVAVGTYLCPSDKGGIDPENPDPMYTVFGTSYALPAADVYPVLELFGAIRNPNDYPEDRDKARKAVSRAYEEYSMKGYKLAVLIDWDAFHGSGTTTGRNALYWDGSADLYPGDPPDEIVENILELIFKLCNFGR